MRYFKFYPLDAIGGSPGVFIVFYHHDHAHDILVWAVGWWIEPMSSRMPVKANSEYNTVPMICIYKLPADLAKFMPSPR